MSCASRVSIPEITPASFSTLSCWFIVIQPVWRHGFEMDALAKQTFFAPGLLNFEVSTSFASMVCRYG